MKGSLLLECCFLRFNPGLSSILLSFSLLSQRQDILSLLLNVFRPTNDEVLIKLRMDEMDSFVMCLASKKVASKYVKDMTDIVSV